MAICTITIFWGKGDLVPRIIGMLITTDSAVSVTNKYDEKFMWRPFLLFLLSQTNAVKHATGMVVA